VKLVQNVPICGKIINIILNQGKSGHSKLLVVLEEVESPLKENIILAALYHPTVLKLVVLPMVLEDLQSKTLPLVRRNQAAAILARFGMLLEDQAYVKTISDALRLQYSDPSLLSNALVFAGTIGRKEYLCFLSSNISAKLKQAICLQFREFDEDDSLPSIQIKLVSNIETQQYDPISKHIWGFEGEISPRTSTLEASSSEPILLVNQAEGESMLRKFLQSCTKKQLDTRGTYPSSEKLIGAYWILMQGSGIVKTQKISKQALALLGDCMAEEDPLVREAALTAVGSINLPNSGLLLPKVEQ
jgi:hypothetical protein